MTARLRRFAESRRATTRPRLIDQLKELSANRPTEGVSRRPDSKLVAQGITGMVALGRQGNYFLWGFASPPSEMPPSARTCFRSVVHDIKRSDGQKPVIRKPEDGVVTRKLVRRQADLAPVVLDPDELRKLAPHSTTNDAEKTQAIRNMELRILREAFPTAIIEQGATNPAAYRAWVEANDRWLVPGGSDEADGIRAIAVNEDLKALGLDNRLVATLDACVRLLASKSQADQALRTLQRSTGQTCATAAEWQTWLDAHRARLVFTEVGGFRFVVADSGTAAQTDLGDRIPLNPLGPTQALSEPVQLAGSIEPPPVRW